MKLIDIIVESVDVWPENVVCYTQDYNKNVWGCSAPNPRFYCDKVWRCNNGYTRGYTEHKELAEDYSTTKVTKEMWERAKMKKVFTIDDIKDGMRVRVRCGTMYIRIGDTFRNDNGFNRVSNYNYDMTIGGGRSNSYDIVEVYDDNECNSNARSVGKLLWERSEMTQEEKDILELEEIIQKAQEKIQSLKKG